MRRNRHAYEIERQFDERREGYIGEIGDATEVVIDGKVNLKELVEAITKQGEYNASNRKV